MGLDTASILAGLLHDCVEDTASTCDEITSLFGAEVSALVDGVTRLGKIKYRTQEEEQMEDLRKMFLAMAKDIRVILIKLADRLHNMRTISVMPPEKQRKKALETMQIYAPIAHRLGMQRIKWELEDLALICLDPVGYKEILDGLNQKAKARNEFIEQIKAQIGERLTKAGINFKTEGRIKHIYSIYRKMYTQQKTMDEIYDICAVRVIVDTVPDCYNVLGFVHDLYKPIPGRFKDYIGTPKPNGYRSLHTTVIGREGIPFEVQIRTFEMHRMAEYGVAAHWKYKSGVKSSANDQAFAWIRSLVEAQQDSDAEDFIKTIRVDLFSDEVFVFTPNGDLINLPKGATPIDFAYAIHSEVGNRMTGAKIGGRIVPIDTKLKNGDIVYILTSKEARGPSRDWLKIIKTNEARNKIRQWFKKERREENIAQGKEELERELKANQLYNVFMQDEVKESLIKKFSYSTLDELYAGIGYGGITCSRILNRVREEMIRITRANRKPPEKAASQRKNPEKSGGIIVEGLDDCLVKFARCCTPIPGDDIIGYVTKGYGVSVHRKDCVNASPERIFGNEHERWVNVWWSGFEKKSKYTTSLKIYGKTRLGLLADIAMTLSNLKVNVIELSGKDVPETGESVISTLVQVSDVNQLESIILKLKAVKGVSRIKRT